jgi:hypothetical protein
MNIRLVATLAVLGVTPAFGQGQPPAVSKADVQKAVDSIKADKSKMDAFCALQKLDTQAETIAQKYTDPQKAQNDPQIQAIEKQEQGLFDKLGPDFAKVAGGQMDEASGKLMDALAATCPK